jgi:hypothetical protein
VVNMGPPNQVPELRRWLVGLSLSRCLMTGCRGRTQQSLLKLGLALFVEACELERVRIGLIFMACSSSQLNRAD